MAFIEYERTAYTLLELLESPSPTRLASPTQLAYLAQMDNTVPARFSFGLLPSVNVLWISSSSFSPAHHTFYHVFAFPASYFFTYIYQITNNNNNKTTSRVINVVGSLSRLNSASVWQYEKKVWRTNEVLTRVRVFTRNPSSRLTSSFRAKTFWWEEGEGK